MKLHLLIDTSVWFDLAQDYRQLPTIDALGYFWRENGLDLIVPSTILEEFQRNKERVISDSKRSLASHFRLVREAVEKFAPEGERDAALRQLAEVDHRIAVGGEAVNDAIEQIERLLASAPKIEPTEALKARAADRAIAKIAPCHRQRNSISDAVLIETYAQALSERQDADDIFAFVSHNTHDFSARTADIREPHPDLAGLFSGDTSRYVINLAAFLNEFAPAVIEEVRFEREFSQQPRKLSELLEAEHKLMMQVWYNRKWNIIARVESGEQKRVSKEIWEAAKPKERQAMIVDTLWDGMLVSMKKTEEEFPDELGPWDDFEWGMINGKLSAIRWMLGDEWDMLDT